MATDPTIPTDPTAAPVVTDPAVLAAYEAGLRRVTIAQKGFNVEGAESATMLESLQQHCASAGLKLEDMGNLSGVAAAKFGLFATGIIGATERFKDFNSNIDSRRLGSFSDQMKSLITNVSQNGTALGATTSAGAKLIGILGSMGVTGKEMAGVMTMGSTQLAAFAKNVLTSADNSLRFESALMDAASQAGNFNELYKGTGGTFKGVGDHLTKLNSVYEQFAGIMGDTMLATHKSTDEIGKYAISIASMPGGLEALSKSMEVAGQKTTLLTGIIQFADGAGLNVEKTMQDVAKATAQFGIQADDAFKYTARIVDISGDLHAQQTDVEAALMKTSEAFRLYNRHGVDSIKMSQGLADTVKSYAASLEAAGVPAQTAIELSQKYTTQLSNMNEAQEAFVSQQAGGPGGLAGTFAFEKLLEHDPAAAAKQQQDAMKKVMGAQKLVTKDQAENDPALQQQYMKQRQILMSGVMGVKADSKAEADAKIQSMIEGKPITDTDTSKALGDTIKKGQEKEQLAATSVQQMDITAEMVRLQASGMNLSTLQNATTARSGAGGGGVDGAGRGTSPENVDRLRAAQLAGMHPDEGSGKEKMGRAMGKAVNDIVPSIQDMGKSLIEQITQPASTAVAIPTSTPTTTTTTPTTPSLGLGRLGAGGFTPNLKPAGTDYTPSGRQVGQALPSGQTTGATTHSATTTRTASGVASTGPASAQPIPVMLAGGSAITINFTGKCPHCGSNIHTSEQAAIQSPASVARS